MDKVFQMDRVLAFLENILTDDPSSYDIRKKALEFYFIR